MDKDPTRLGKHIPDFEGWADEYESRSISGRLSLLVESGVKIASSAIDSVIDHTSAVVARTKKSFDQGMDPNLEEARIIEEIKEPYKDSVSIKSQEKDD